MQGAAQVKHIEARTDVEVPRILSIVALAGSVCHQRYQVSKEQDAMHLHLIGEYTELGP